jgi:hypothetical protein
VIAHETLRKIALAGKSFTENKFASFSGAEKRQSKERTSTARKAFRVRIPNQFVSEQIGSGV